MSCEGMNPGNASYFFQKSLNNLLLEKDVLAGELRLLKSQMAICENGEMPSSTSGDPILNYALGFAKRPSRHDIIEYCKQGLAENCLADLRIFLGLDDVAQKLVTMEAETAAKWFISLQADDKTSGLEAERSGYLLHFVTGHKVSTLCEMAVRWSLWDAFILMSLLFADNEVMIPLRAFVWKKLDLGWIDELQSEPSEPLNMESLAKLGYSTMKCYQTLMSNLRDNKADAFARSCLYSSMRVYLLYAVCDSEMEGRPSELMKEYLNFVSSEPVFLQESLPGLQRAYFEKASVVILDFIRVVLHICKMVKNENVARYEDDSSGVLSNLVDSWMKKNVLSQDSSLAEASKGISGVLHSFIGDLLESPEIFSNGSCYRVHILLALLMAEVLFRNNLASSNGVLIFDLLAKCDFKEDLINRLLKKISSPRRDTSPSENMISSLRDCLLRVRNLFSEQSHFQMQSTDHFERLGLNTAVESVKSREEYAPLKAASVPSSADRPGEDHASFKKVSDNAISHPAELNSGSSLYRSPSTELDLMLLGKLQSKTVQDSIVPLDHGNLEHASRIEPESIVSQDNMLVTQLTTKWEQPTTNATQANSSSPVNDQMGNVEPEKEIVDKSNSCDNQGGQNNRTLASPEEKIEQTIAANSVKESPFEYPSDVNSKNEVPLNNVSTVEEPTHIGVASTPSTSTAIPSPAAVNLPTSNAPQADSFSKPPAQQSAPQQVSMFSSQFKQQASGWGSDDENDTKSSFGAASQSGGGGSFGAQSGGYRGGGGRGNTESHSYGGGRGSHNGDRGNYGGDRGSYGGGRGSHNGDRGSYRGRGGGYQNRG